MSDDGLTVGNDMGAPVSPADDAAIQERIVAEPSQDGSPQPPAATAQDAPQAEKPVMPDWPDDWREKLAGGDEKALKRLGRFASPAGIFKSFRELESKFSRGELAPKAPELPENATPEQIEAYRKATGVPIDGKYDTALGEGFNWADGDQAVLEDFQKAAHEMNMPQGEFKKALAWYADYQQRQVDAMAERDNSTWAQTEDSLRKEWGQEYRLNENLIKSFLTANFPEEVVNKLATARDAYGTKILADREVIQGLVAIARELNPVPTLAPSASGDKLNSIGERKAAIEGMMAQGRTGPYWSGPNAQALQNEYLELVQAEQKLKTRVA